MFEDSAPLVKVLLEEGVQPLDLPGKGWGRGILLQEGNFGCESQEGRALIPHCSVLRASSFQHCPWVLSCRAEMSSQYKISAEIVI